MSGAETGFVHPALFYSGREDYLAGVGGFIREGLDAGAPVFVAVPPDRLTALAEYLGPDADRVEFVDMTAAGRNPGRILTALTDFAGKAPPGRAWLVGEPIWAGRSPAEIREATRHEALINLAFDGVAATILCPYDVTALPRTTLADAERTHPVLWTGGTELASTAYTDPLILNAELDILPKEEPPEAVRIPFGRADLHYARGQAREFGSAAGLTPARAVDFFLAVGEALANTIRHGGGAGTLTLWREPGGAGGPGGVVAEIQDEGRLGNPLAGRRRPAMSAVRGRGLWMIHHLCDLVELGPGLLRLHVHGDVTP